MRHEKVSKYMEQSKEPRVAGGWRAYVCVCWLDDS